MKTNTEVLIAGKVYTLSGNEGEEYLQKVASYLNGKISELNNISGYSRMASDMKNILLNLNIADDYFKEKSKVADFESCSENKDNEIYDLKHELISAQLKMEEYEKEIKRLEAENKELLLNKARLETSLEDALFNKTTKTKK